MAKFKYLGEPPMSAIKTWGPILAFVARKKDGTKQRIDAPDPVRGFLTGDVIDYEVTDPFWVRDWEHNPRFERIS